MLLMRLPRERLIFTVDWIPVRVFFSRTCQDFTCKTSKRGSKRVLALEWDRNIPAHGSQLGTKPDPQTLVNYLADLSRRGEEGGRRRQVPGCRKERDQAAEIRILDELP